MPTGVYPRKPRKNKFSPKIGTLTELVHVPMERGVVSTFLNHSFARVDGTAFGDFESCQMGSGRLYYKVTVWFPDKEAATEYFNKAGGAYAP